MLVPTDLSEEASHTLEYAFTFASALDIEILVLHVVDGRVLQPLTYAFEDLKADYHEKLSQKDMAEEIKDVLDKEIQKGITYDHKLRVTTMVRYGVPYDQIVKVAEQEKADFIVMGANGHTSLPDIFIGGVAEKVSRRAPCPVFLIRHRRHLD